MFAIGDAGFPEVILASSIWLQTCQQFLGPTQDCDTMLVKKMVSLHCLAKNIENYTCGVYLCICKDTSAFY